jgi:hypothetical protein
MSTLNCALVIVVVILLTCLAVNAVNQQKEYATTATLGLGAVAVGALAVSNMDSLKSGGVSNMEKAQRIIDEWGGPYQGWMEGMLNLSNLNLKELPKLPIGVRQLNCAGNELESLPDLPDSLTWLNCSNNQLQSLLDKIPNGLRELYCKGNQLQSLPQLPEGLVVLECNDNEIMCLPVLPSSLSSLTISVSKLKYPPPEKLPDGDPNRSPPGGKLIDKEWQIGNIRKYMKENENERPKECNETTY